MDSRINVWVKENNNWVQGVLVSENNNLYKIEVNEEIKYYDTYFLKNEDNVDDIDNMIDIPHLNEPSILNGINIRYNNDRIYTYTGNILISVNPFKDLGLYGNDIISDYNTEKINKPHIYSIARDSYNNLKKKKKNQSILVSGESGAGKTHATKIMMEYLTSVSGKNKEIENKILLSNPILESFGNAKTIRNDNSSRFGKFIKLKFNNNKLEEAQIDTYLLEKVRLIYQSDNERNFHIFYNILNGMSNDDMKKYMINNNIKYNYLKNGLIKRDDNVNDSDEYKIIIDGFKKIGILDEEIDYILRITCSILNIGNIKYDEDGNIINKDQIKCITELLDLDNDKLLFTLTKRNLLVSNENIVIKLNKEECIYTRDSLSMKLYHDLFNHIVYLINMSLKNDNITTNFIGILDIFGFESIQNNSFEQLCINYTNEHLQNQFNKYIFKLEQEEYKKEKINWQSITFPDNEKCLRMIDSKNGILGMLDEECKLPKGNDKNYTLKLNKKYGDTLYFEEQKRYINQKFGINHYAGNVIYNTKNFCDKNKDLVSNEINDCLNGIIVCNNDNKVNISSIKLKSVGYQFKKQLNQLINVIDDTETHYVRCIKPNDLNKDTLFNREKVINQLKYCGVIEAIKVARSGYSVRMNHNIFLDRYRMINECNNICNIHNLEFMNDSTCQIGLTKIFLKSDTYDDLECLRVKKLSYYLILIQKNFRRYMIEKKYLNIYEKIILLQGFCRIIISKKIKLRLKRTECSIVITRNYRRLVIRRKYLLTLEKIKKIQRYYRNYIRKKIILKIKLLQKFIRKRLLKKKLYNKIKHNNAVLIQKNIRKYLCKNNFKNTIKKIIFIQRLYRKNKKSSIILIKKNKNLQKKLDEKKKIEKINLDRINKLEEEQLKMKNIINDIKDMCKYNKDELNNKESEIIILNDDVDLYKETIIKTIDSKANMFEELEQIRRENEILKKRLLSNKNRSWFNFNFLK
jgi:myosin VIIa